MFCHSLEFAFLKVGVVFKKRSILRSFLPLAMLILRALFPTSLLVSKTSKAVQVLYIAMLYAIYYMLYVICCMLRAIFLTSAGW